MSKAEYLAELDRIEAQTTAAMQATNANAQQIELAAIKRMAIAYKAFKGQHDDRATDHRRTITGLFRPLRARFAPTGGQSTTQLPPTWARCWTWTRSQTPMGQTARKAWSCTFSAIPKDGVASQRAASKRSLNPCCAPTDTKSNELEK